jgi:hypothetical protein
MESIIRRFGDHLAPGNAFLYEYDPATRKFRQLLDLKKLLNLRKVIIHPARSIVESILDKTAWLYCSTASWLDQDHYGCLSL